MITLSPSVPADFGAPAQASGFSFSASNSGFGSAATQSSSTGFGDILAAPTQPPSGFGTASSSTPSASSFSFASTTTDKPAPASGFGSASGFSFPTGASSSFRVGAPATTGSSSLFGQTSGGFGAAATQPTSGTGSAEGASDSLFSPESKLTEEELSQFKAKKFTLGQIPLKPPPFNLLVVWYCGEYG